MQRVDILRAEKEPIAEHRFERGQRLVRGIGCHRAGLRAPQGIEAPHQSRVLGPPFGRRYFLDAVLLPEASRVAKRLDPALGADACAGQHEHLRTGRQIERRERLVVIDPSHAVSLTSLLRMGRFCDG